MDEISLPADVWALAGRLVIATLLGAAVGLNREMSLKPAGLRTHALVSLGAALMMLTGLLLTSAEQGDAAAPGRVIQGIVAGVGFIGGGVILHRADLRGVHGLTTAASIWIVAATGIAVGAGLWRAAVIAVLLSLLILTLGGPIDRVVRRTRGDRSDDD
ncbi:MAG: MgtC/SapB family protein [Acidobacteria bacterium]|nr:MgtC/SapB family protein [Acidobacteriota bacterium]